MAQDPVTVKLEGLLPALQSNNPLELSLPEAEEEGAVPDVLRFWAAIFKVWLQIRSEQAVARILSLSATRETEALALAVQWKDFGKIMSEAADTAIALLAPGTSVVTGKPGQIPMIPCNLQPDERTNESFEDFYFFAVAVAQQLKRHVQFVLAPNVESLRCQIPKVEFFQFSPMLAAAISKMLTTNNACKFRKMDMNEVISYKKPKLSHADESAHIKGLSAFSGILASWIIANDAPKPRESQISRQTSATIWNEQMIGFSSAWELVEENTVFRMIPPMC